MRIGLITGEYPPMQGGVGDYSRELARALVGLGHEVYILTSTKARPLTPEAGIHVQASVENWGRWSKGSSPRGTQQALAWLRQNQLDVVNVQYQAAAYNMHAAANDLPKILSKYAPVFTTFHDLLVPYLFPKAGRLRKRIIYQMARHSTGVIVTNLVDEQELAALDKMPPVARIPIGSNIAASPPADFSPESWRLQKNILPEVFLVGYFGFINASKGVDTLAQAIRILLNKGVNAELMIIGGQTGDSDKTNIQQADEAERLVGGLGINRRVHWTGFVPPTEVSAWLMACDTIALPYKDGVSFRRGTLMAALGHACPIVTTHPEVELPELATNNPLLLVEPNNPEQLANALLSLYNDPALRTRLGQAAGELAKQFRWETIAASTIEFMQQVWIKSSPASAD